MTALIILAIAIVAAYISSLAATPVVRYLLSCVDKLARRKHARRAVATQFSIQDVQVTMQSRMIAPVGAPFVLAAALLITTASIQVTPTQASVRGI